jgi:prephenate dehydrogenase
MPRLLVIGTGLIGGSFALAMREAGCFGHVEGYDVDPAAAARAAQLGVIDSVADDRVAAIGAADAVFIAIPTLGIADCVRQIAAHPGRRTITVFDAGSVKRSVLDALRRGGGVPPWFVPSHPMAGSERHGPAAADANLFRGRRVIVAPQPNSDRAAVERVNGWWRATGATVVETSAAIHDEMVALTSHLPHLVAYAFMDWVAQPHSGNPRDFMGPGLRDFTRIAAAEPQMWRQISLENRTAILTQFEGFAESLEAIIEHLRQGRFDELEALLAAAQRARIRLTDPSND